MAGIGKLPSGVPNTAAAPQYSKGDDTTDFGDFVSTEEEEIYLEDAAEPWYKYDRKETERVLYPICLGEVLNERYLVEHKISHGGFSTVCMAHDFQKKRDVALKVMCSGEWGDHEMHMQDEITQNAQYTSHLVIYLATFLLPGDKPHHRALVFPWWAHVFTLLS